MSLGALLEEILVDAYDEHEQITTFHCALSELDWPTSAKLGDMDLVVQGVDWDGQASSAMDAEVSYDGHEFEVDFQELIFPEGSSHARHVAALRQWLGLS